MYLGNKHTWDAGKILANEDKAEIYQHAQYKAGREELQDVSRFWRCWFLIVQKLEESASAINIVLIVVMMLIC